jgi:DNA-binding IclR family transcriptional regulator
MLRQTEDRRYAAGPGLSVLGAIATSQQSMLPIMVPRMHRLTEQFQCTCALGTLWRDRVTYLAVTGADKDPRTAVGANPSYPLEQSSIGILLLSWQENTYAHEHGLTASLPAAEAARAAGLARLKQPGGRVSLALPIASTAGAPHLALACSLPEQVATEADLLIAMRQAVEQ